MRADGRPWAPSAHFGDGSSIWDRSRDRQNRFAGVGAGAGRDNRGVLEMTREEFEELGGEALHRIPAELTRLMDNVAVFVEDEPPSGEPELLGLYEGTPLTERGEWYAGVLPDRITVYRGPTLRMCSSREDVVAETEVTVVPDIAHHFRIEDARLP